MSFKAANLSVQFYLFGTGSVLNERSLLNSKLTSNGTDLGKIYYTRVVDNFDTFPASTYTPSCNKWLRSNHLWKSSGVAGIYSFQDRSVWLTELMFEPSSQWRPRKFKTSQI
jgi:hypothetical protein